MKKTSGLLCLAFISLAWLLSGFHTVPLISVPSGDSMLPVAMHARDFKGKTEVSVAGVIELRSGLDNDLFQADSLNRTGYFYIETKIAAFLNQQVSSVPLNISIVIDRSGSMQGVKMGNAKKAAKSIIDQLKPSDFVSVVMYDNIVDSVQPPVQVTDKESIKKKIDGITARSATNLWGGTEKGYEYVQRNYRPGYINRVLLISDGLANAGLTDSALIQKKVQQFKDDQGITLSTFGVGLDYNETLMTQMAESGQGNYFFIDDPSRMATIFQRELQGLMNVAAQNAELKIRFPQGVRIQNGYPFQFSQQGQEIVVKFRDLFSEEIKGMLFRFSIDNNINAELRFHTTLVYTNVTDGAVKTLANTNLLQPASNRGNYLVHFNKPVVQQAVLLTANERMEKAMQEVDKGEYSNALHSLEDVRIYLRNHSRFTGGEEFARLDSVNANYTRAIVNARHLSADSVKKIQKVNKAENYKIRNKKQ